MAAIIAIGTPKEKPVTPTMTLPADAVSQDGVAPEVGDEIEHSVKGKVTKVSGDNVTISVSAIDGAPVEGSPEEESGETPEEESAEDSGRNPGNSANPGNPGPSNPGNPLAAILKPPRTKAKAATAALGAALRKRARGAPVPLM